MSRRGTSTAEMQPLVARDQDQRDWGCLDYAASAFCCLATLGVQSCCAFTTVREGQADQIFAWDGKLSIVVGPQNYLKSPLESRGEHIRTGDILEPLAKAELLAGELQLMLDSQVTYQITNPRDYAVAVQNGGDAFRRMAEGVVLSVIRHHSATDFMPALSMRSEVREAESKVAAASDASSAAAGSADIMAAALPSDRGEATGQQAAEREILDEIAKTAKPWGITVKNFHFTKIKPANQVALSEVQTHAMKERNHARIQAETEQMRATAQRDAAKIHFDEACGMLGVDSSSAEAVEASRPAITQLVMSLVLAREQRHTVEASSSSMIFTQNQTGAGAAAQPVISIQPH